MDLREQLQSTLGSTYALEQELGGGMSRVFVATDVTLGRRIVVKAMSPCSTSWVFHSELRWHSSSI